MLVLVYYDLQKQIGYCNILISGDWLKLKPALVCN
jgi:hypothetical protein